jgi:hypothetical protein
MADRTAKSVARYRSLLHKAVRRGYVELVLTTSALLDSLLPARSHWLRKRAVTIAFGECWPLAKALVFDSRLHSTVAWLVRSARASKQRDAAGLGYLAFRLARGDRSVLGHTPSDRHLNIVANAVARPDDFWRWIRSRKAIAPQNRDLLERAMKLKRSGGPRDRAVVKAAAYLATLADLPAAETAPAGKPPFPYWVVFDRHTPQGRRVFQDVARDLHLSLRQLEWVHFYFEGSACNGDQPSYWWHRLCAWQYQRVGLPEAESRLVWDPVRPHIVEALASDSRSLHRDLYRWKLRHLEQIHALRAEVELFIERSGRAGRTQQELF